LTLSFRTRLFAVSALIVGAVLLAAMTFGWSRVLEVEVERLDDRLCMEARRVATQPFRGGRGDRGDSLSRLESDVALKLRLASPEQLMIGFDPANEGAGGPSIRWRGAPLADSLVWTPSRQRDALVPPPERLRRSPPGEPLDEPHPHPRPRPGPPALDTCALASFTSGNREWRAARYDAPAGRSVMAADLASVRAELQSALRSTLTFVIPIALGLTALSAWVLSSLSLRPVNRLRVAMKDVTQQALDRRLPSDGEDREFKALIGDYNTMLARLEASFHQASRFSADAAHELKTPLTILQGRLENAVRRSDTLAVQADLTDMLDEVGRLATITRKLLLLSQADAGRLPLSLAHVDLAELLGELMIDAQMLVTDQGLSCDIEPDLVTRGDALLLRQLFNNLVNNAVRYCRPGGAIEVRSRKLPGGVETTFTNPTRAIAAEERGRFFERFFRGDPAHSRRVEGSGLGLSLAREIARAHGGELTLELSAPDEVKLRIWLPRP
jgi:two-component system, OmpR family, heavy metal sensor histidine kinase CusS